MSRDAALDDTLITHELATRASRAPDFAAENRALVRLAQALDRAPKTILATLAQTSLELCRAESAGISILENGVIFRWHAVAGRWAQFVDEGMPRSASPSGMVLDRNSSLLFADPGQYFPEMAKVDPLAVEELLFPFYSGDVAVGTVWVVTHTAGRTFDAEDARLLQSLSSFASAAYQVEQRWRAEDARDRSQAAFQAVLVSAPTAIALIDADGKLVFVNELATRLFGFESGEMIGLAIDALVPARLRQRHAQHRAAYAADPANRPMGRELDIVGRRKDGTEFPIDVSLNSITGADGRPIVLAFITDLGPRRAVEKRTRDHRDKLQHMTFDTAAAQERDRRRIAVELHDRIGQPLALAQINLTSIDDSWSGPRAVIGDTIALIKQAVHDTRTLTFELSPPILYDLGLGAALSWLAEQVELSRGQRVEVHDAAEAISLDDTTAAIAFRTVRELVINSFKHAHTSLTSIWLRPTAGWLSITVEDQGVGFDVTAEANLSSGGFGLFSVREQISRLGGTVEITSTPGQGTSVCFRVPLHPSAGDAGR